MYKQLIDFFKSQENSLYTLIIIILACIVTYFLIYFRNKTQNYTSEKYKLIHILVEASYVSLIILLWLNILLDRNNILLQFLDNQTLNILMKIKSISIAWLLWLSFSRFIKQLENSIVNNEIFKFIKDKSIIKFITSVLTIVVYVIMFALLLGAFGLQLSGFFKVLGASSLLIGFVTQKIVGSFLNGLLFKFREKVKIGDTVNLRDKNIIGKITKIGITTTDILMLDQQTITVPNEVFTTTTLINVSNVQRRCVEFVVNIPSIFANDLDQIIQQIKSSLETSEMVYSAVVLCSELTEYNISTGYWFVTVKIRAFVKTKDTTLANNIKSQLMIKTIQVLDSFTSLKNKNC